MLRNYVTYEAQWQGRKHMVMIINLKDMVQVRDQEKLNGTENNYN